MQIDLDEHKLTGTYYPESAMEAAEGKIPCLSMPALKNGGSTE
jgi:hypothetical protein